MKVECAICNSQFDPLFDNPFQAMNCSSEYQKSTRRLFGHYGSTVIDMQIWKFEDDPELPDQSVICDDCITKNINEGNLVKIRDFSDI